MLLTKLLTEIKQKNASDLHLRSMLPPVLRVDGNLYRGDHPPLTTEEIEAMAETIMNDNLKKKFLQKCSIDTAYSVPGVGRFRVNIFRQRGTTSLAFRKIPFAIPTIESLNLPQVIKSFCNKPQGLVIVTGPTGCGKSSTLAAMIQLITQTNSLHIVTIE